MRYYPLGQEENIEIFPTLLVDMKKDKEKIKSLNEEAFHNWKRWSDLFQSEKGVIRDTSKKTFNPSIFNRKGIVYEFSNLKTEKDIEKFATKYGMLGIGTPLIDDGTPKKLLEQRENFDFESVTAGYSYYEPLEIWFFYIQQINKCLKLYKALVNAHKGEKVEIEDKILKIGHEFRDIHTNKLIGYWILWHDNRNTGTFIPEDYKIDFIDIGRKVLIENIRYKAMQRIAINPEIIVTRKPPLGFVLKENKYTPFLITAIYYDLWELIANNEPVYFCENPNCKLPFPKVKRQKYCSNACKQEAYRIRKRQKQIQS